MTSSGLYNQNQLIFNVNSKVSSAVSLFGYYVLNRAKSNSDGLNTFPANAYNYSGEYGPASTDIHNRFIAAGTIGLRWAIRLNPYVTMQSGVLFQYYCRPGPVWNYAVTTRVPALRADRQPSGARSPRLTGVAAGSQSAAHHEEILDQRRPGPADRVRSHLRVNKTWGFSVRSGTSGEAVASRGGGQSGQVLQPQPPAACLRRRRAIVEITSSQDSVARVNLLNDTNPAPTIGIYRVSPSSS